MMARVDQWEPRNSGSPKHKVWQTIGWIAVIVMFMGAAMADIFRPIYIPPAHHAKPTVSWGYTLGANGTQVPIGGVN